MPNPCSQVDDAGSAIIGLHRLLIDCRCGGWSGCWCCFISCCRGAATALHPPHPTPPHPTPLRTTPIRVLQELHAGVEYPGIFVQQDLPKFVTLTRVRGCWCSVHAPRAHGWLLLMQPPIELSSNHYLADSPTNPDPNPNPNPNVKHETGCSINL